jgi:hypothetical protein
MPRKISPETLATISQETGLEPINVIRVQWVAGGGYNYYADRNVQGQPQIEGKLLTLNNLEAVVNIETGASSTSVNVVLNDTDGTLKQIFNTHDIHSRNVVIYQWFTSTSINEMFSLYEGMIASPIIWAEGDRTLAFDVITKIEDIEVGFSVEDGDFLNVPDSILGKPWPMVFGTVINMPTLRLDDMPTGTTLIPIGIRDPSVANQIALLNYRVSAQLGKAVCLSLRAAELSGVGGGGPQGVSTTAPTLNNSTQANLQQAGINDAIYGTTTTISYPTSYPGTVTQQQKDTSDAAQKAAMASKAAQLYQQSNQMRNSAGAAQSQKTRLSAIDQNQSLYDVKNIPIANGSLFHQGVEVEIEINRAHYTGIFNGNNFTVISRRGPDESVPRAPDGSIAPGYTKYVNLIGGTQYRADNDPSQQPSTSQGGSGGVTIPSGFGVSGVGGGGGVTGIGGGGQKLEFGMPADYWACNPPYFFTVANRLSDAATPHVAGKSFFANAGASVKPGADYTLRYILSITPGVQVLYVSARVSVGAYKVLSIIPPQYYSLGTINFPNSNPALGGITATIATFFQPMSSIEDADWENEIYATLSSSIGPNVVDILTYIIQTYTTFGIDYTSFNHVRSLIEGYPAGFALMRKKGVISLLKEIAWQACCAVWLADGIFYIRFLQEQGDVIDTITEDDIEQKTMEITTTATEDLTTKFIATWKADQSISQNSEIILQYNVAIYGLIEHTYDFYIYNVPACVVKNATFWLLRLANVWKKLKCKAFLTKLRLETQDNILIHFSRDYIADGDVIGTVEKSTFDSANFSIDFLIWTPVRLGEMTPYPFAYPVGVSTTFFYPTVAEVASGQFGPAVATGSLSNPYNGPTVNFAAGLLFKAVNGPKIYDPVATQANAMAIYNQAKSTQQANQGTSASGPANANAGGGFVWADSSGNTMSFVNGHVVTDTAGDAARGAVFLTRDPATGVYRVPPGAENLGTTSTGQILVQTPSRIDPITGEITPGQTVAVTPENIAAPIIVPSSVQVDSSGAIIIPSTATPEDGTIILQPSPENIAAPLPLPETTPEAPWVVPSNTEYNSTTGDLVIPSSPTVSWTNESASLPSSDMNVEPIDGAVTPPVDGTIPSYDYEYRNGDVPNVTLDPPDTLVVMPGIAVEIGEGSVTAVGFPSGFSGKAQQYDNVAVLSPQLGADQKLKAGTGGVLVYVPAGGTASNPAPTLKYFIPDLEKSASFPGLVISGSGNTYQVQIWIHGMSNPPKTVTATQLQINDDVVPPGTSVLVSYVYTSKGEDEYTMQVPVWVQ